MELKNKSTAELKEVKKNLYVLEYGTLNRGSDGNRKMSLTDDSKYLKHTVFITSCGCSTPTFTQIDAKELEINIHYNTNLLGTFSKSIEWKFLAGKEKKSITIKLKGNVV